jgi:hypothetical protein
MDFDEWEHVFIAAAPRSTDYHFLLRQDAHPGLFYRMLRMLLHVGHGVLLYRSIPIIAGTVSVFVMGLICRKAFRSRALSLLGALALALSSVAITISTEVRGYELSVCFALIAFRLFLEICSPGSVRPRLRTYCGFAFFMCMALEADYFAVFVLGASIASCLLLAGTSREFRATYASRTNRTHAGLLVMSFFPPIAIVLAMYFGSLRGQPVQGYLYPFYWSTTTTPGEGLGAFLLRNITNEWNLFSPVPIHDPRLVVLAIGILVSVGVYLLVLDARSPTSISARIPFPFVLFLAIELVVLSVTCSYPFGGLLRHQYIIAPFLIIAAFAVADTVTSKPWTWLRAGVPGVLTALILANALVAAPKLVVNPGGTEFTSDYNEYRAAFPHSDGVYLSHFTVIEYFTRTDGEPRRFVRQVFDPIRIDEYQMGRPGERTITLFHDKGRYVPDLTDETLYRSLAACLRQSQVRELTLFYNLPWAGKPLPLAPEPLKRKMIELAERHGMSVNKIVVDGNRVFAGFSLAR